MKRNQGKARLYSRLEGVSEGVKSIEWGDGFRVTVVQLFYNDKCVINPCWSAIRHTFENPVAV